MLYHHLLYSKFFWNIRGQIQQQKLRTKMHRSDGLVQRRVATVNNGNTSNSNQEMNTDDNQLVNGDFGDTSKDTRFTLMEEVLLLGLKDKEV